MDSDISHARFDRSFRPPVVEWPGGCPLLSSRQTSVFFRRTCRASASLHEHVHQAGSRTFSGFAASAVSIPEAFKDFPFQSLKARVKAGSQTRSQSWGRVGTDGGSASKLEWRERKRPGRESETSRRKCEPRRAPSVGSPTLFWVWISFASSAGAMVLRGCWKRLFRSNCPNSGPILRGGLHKRRCTQR